MPQGFTFCMLYSFPVGNRNRVHYFFFFNVLFIFEREGEQRRGRKRRGQRIQSRLHADSSEPHACEIVTWAEVGPQPTEAPRCPETEPILKKKKNLCDHQCLPMCIIHIRAMSSPGQGTGCDPTGKNEKQKRQVPNVILKHVKLALHLTDNLLNVYKVYYTQQILLRLKRTS